MTVVTKIGEWARNLDQKQRNAFYKLMAALGGVAIAYGIVGPEELEAIITAGGSILTLLSTLLAIPTSGKKVTVQDKPVEQRFIGDDYIV